LPSCFDQPLPDRGTVLDADRRQISPQLTAAS